MTRVHTMLVGTDERFIDYSGEYSRARGVKPTPESSNMTY